MKKHLSFLTVLCMLLCCVSVSAEECGKTSEDFEPLCALAEKYGFRLGTCYSYSQLRDTAYLSIAARHFNSITCTNETKAYSLLDQTKSRMSPDGMPRMNYSQADAMLRWAMENNVKVRGHVLVWDAYMTDWFFHENYDSKKPIASQETLRARLRSYIEQVVTHFEEKFPGVIYCWDVVNEAIGDNAGEFDASDPCHTRQVRNGARNPFYDYVGADYIEYAFLCAKDTVEALGADIRLFYNDYNMFYPAKRGAACQLIKKINSYAQDADGNDRKLIDGIGMQGYIGGYGTQSGCLNNADIASIRQSILTYASYGLEVHLTEMAVRNYELKNAAAHADFYASLFRMFTQVNAECDGALTAVCIWGLNDCPQLPQNNYTWKLNSPYGGLLTEKNALKTSFEKVYGVLKGE